MSFEHIYLNPRENEKIYERAQNIQTQVNAGQDWREAGDPFILERRYERQNLNDINKNFGAFFTREIENYLPEKINLAPNGSAYGLHLVRIIERIEPVEKSFDEVREQITQDLKRRKAYHCQSKAIDEVIAKYSVVFKISPMTKMPRLFSLSFWLVHICLLGALFLAHSNTVQAHETRPAYLNLIEKQAGQFALVWKQPVKDNARLAIKPVFDVECIIGSSQFSFMASPLLKSPRSPARFNKAPSISKGLESTLTDTYVTINYLDGTQNAGIVKPDNPVFNLTDKQDYSVIAYLELGIEHIF